MTAEWQRVADDLRWRIGDGAWADDPLPSMPKLAARYGVSVLTVRKALERLEAGGLLIPGRQWQVREHRPLDVHISDRESLTWQQDMTRAGLATAQRISVQLKGDDVVRRVARDVDGEPFEVAEWAFPRAVARKAPRLEDDADIPEGAVRYLEGLGWAVRQDKAFEARMPSPAEARELGIRARGVPVIVEYRTGSQDGMLLFDARKRIRADRARLIP